MKRLYESDHHEGSAVQLKRREHRTPRLQSSRTINATALTQLFLPKWLHERVLSIDIDVQKPIVPSGEQVPFTVEIRNRAPFPVVIQLDSPVLWRWYLNGNVEASVIAPDGAPKESVKYRFERGETKRFLKRWNGMIRTGKRDWEFAEPGEYELEARVNVPNATTKRLVASTTIEVT